MKLLLVDDELYTREGLTKTVDWPSLGVEEVTVAANAEQALRLFREEAPDILLCDIRLPGMSGIDLARTVRSISPDCQILMMSGYNDRQYVIDAVDLRAAAFIDKPINDAVMKRAVLGAVEQIKKIRNQRGMERAAYALKREALARQLLSGEGIDRDQYSELMPPRGGESGSYQCILIRPVSPDRMYIPQMLEKLGVWGVVAPDDEGNDALFLRTETSVQKNDAMGALFGIAGAKFAVGEAVQKIESIKRSYESARAAMPSFFFRPHMRYSYANEKNEAMDLLESEENFRKALATGAADAYAHLESLREDLLAHSGTPIELVRVHLYTLASIVLKGRDELIPELLEEIGAESVWEACMRAESLDALEQVVWNALRLAEEQIVRETHNPYSVTAARRYIHRYFSSSSLKLLDIANHAHMSAGHLSALFKYSTGLTLHQYITRCRIERACELLTETQMKNHEIAEQTGFSNPNYFSKVFLNETGMTPSQYRKNGYKAYEKSIQ